MFHLHHFFNKHMNKCWIRRITSKLYIWLFAFSHAQPTFVFLPHSLDKHACVPKWFFFTRNITRKKKKKRQARPDSHLFFVLLHLLSTVQRTENSSSGPSAIPSSASTKIQCYMQCITGWEKKTSSGCSSPGIF